MVLFKGNGSQVTEGEKIMSEETKNFIDKLAR